jgi:hypothetical protein
MGRRPWKSLWWWASPEPCEVQDCHGSYVVHGVPSLVVVMHGGTTTGKGG